MLCLFVGWIGGQIKCKFRTSNGLWEMLFARPAVCVCHLHTFRQNVWISLIRYFHYRHLARTLSRHFYEYDSILGGRSTTPSACVFAAHNCMPIHYDLSQKKQRIASWRARVFSYISAWNCNYAIWEMVLCFAFWCNDVGSMSKMCERRHRRCRCIRVVKTLFATLPLN